MLAGRADRAAALVCEDGNADVVFSNDIPLTDFPREASARSPGGADSDGARHESGSWASGTVANCSVH